MRAFFILICLVLLPVQGVFASGYFLWHQQAQKLLKESDGKFVEVWAAMQSHMYGMIFRKLLRLGRVLALLMWWDCVQLILLLSNLRRKY
jgi:hypothetical protein